MRLFVVPTVVYRPLGRLFTVLPGGPNVPFRPYLMESAYPSG
ncbi:MAG: hypothetical protein Ct9H300mP16_06860 [Pseudomonadota bacterium]|nr:MAG: hypothetical protein Ct9H300mP16_06860 [Pseudomonadota bacterium]